MARKNRLVVEDGIYHVTTRIAHQERLLRDARIKEYIVSTIYAIADFSGITVASWNIMDNHLHLLLHVPPVPEKYYKSGTGPENELGTGPAESRPPIASAFSMRPAENRAPRWSPDITDRNHPITPNGDCPSEEAILRAIAEGVPVAHLPHPPTGFTMSDEEMLGRLRYLYKPKVVEEIAERWANARVHGRDEIVEREKDAYCRRMYNVSQYMKSLKQRISQFYNREYGHEGQLWDGRFYSALVDRTDKLSHLFVTSYIELNSYRTKAKIKPKDWAWCSYSAARGSGRYSARAREGYEKLFGVPWQEVLKRLESVFESKEGEEVVSDDQAEHQPTTMTGLVKTHCRMLERGGFISRSLEFAQKTLSAFSPRFPTVTTRSVGFFSRLDWTLAA